MSEKLVSSDPVVILKNAIKKEEQFVRSKLPTESRLALFEIIRESDAYFVYLMSLNEKKREELDEDNEFFFFRRLGVNRAISICLGNQCNQSGTPLMRSTKKFQDYIEAIIQHCGRIGVSERILDFDHYKLGQLSYVAENEVMFNLANFRYLGLENKEAEEFSIFRKFSDKLDKDRLVKLSKKKSEMLQEMKKYVKPWREHYIQYDTTPEIDDYYEELGFIWTRPKFFEAISFPRDVKFGKLPFQIYMSTIAILIGWDLKHLDFCKALLQKNPGMELRNILTIHDNTEKLSKSLSIVLNITIEDAKEALEILTLNSRNVDIHTSIPGGYLAPLVMVSKEFVIRSISGTLSGDAYFFMLNELKRRFQKDWDRAVLEREQVFRYEIQMQLMSENIYGSLGPIKIRLNNSNVTDIDAAFFDKRNGELGLFQLKWQDFFGDSMRKRETKKKNFLEESTNWIEKVTDIVSSNTNDKIMEMMHLDKVTQTRISKIYLFVIGRNFSHFSGNEVPDERAAWGMWPQMLRILKDGEESGELEKSTMISWLHRKLKVESPINEKNPEFNKDLQYEVGGCKVTFGPEL